MIEVVDTTNSYTHNLNGNNIARISDNGVANTCDIVFANGSVLTVNESRADILEKIRNVLDFYQPSP